MASELAAVDVRRIELARAAIRAGHLPKTWATHGSGPEDTRTPLQRAVALVGAEVIHQLAQHGFLVLPRYECFTREGKPHSVRLVDFPELGQAALPLSQLARLDDRTAPIPGVVPCDTDVDVVGSSFSAQIIAEELIVDEQSVLTIREPADLEGPDVRDVVPGAHGACPTEVVGNTTVGNGGVGSDAGSASSLEGA